MGGRSLDYVGLDQAEGMRLGTVGEKSCPSGTLLGLSSWVLFLGPSGGLRHGRYSKVSQTPTGS